MEFTFYKHVKSQQPVTEDYFVESEVRRALTFSDGGMVEDLDCQLNRLVEVVGKMFAHLPEATQQDIAESLGWTVKK